MRYDNNYKFCYTPTLPFINKANPQAILSRTTTASSSNPPPLRRLFLLCSVLVHNHHTERPPQPSLAQSNGTHSLPASYSSNILHLTTAVTQLSPSHLHVFSAIPILTKHRHLYQTPLCTLPHMIGAPCIHAQPARIFITHRDCSCKLYLTPSSPCLNQIETCAILLHTSTASSSVVSRHWHHFSTSLINPQLCHIPKPHVLILLQNMCANSLSIESSQKTVKHYDRLY